MIEPIPGETLDPDNPPIPGWEDAPVSGGRVDLHEGPLIAGTPGGARVEVREDGLHAYDASGTETATIEGEGGEFVGGSFRTSDTLPGQVTLSDTAYVNSYDDTKQGPGDPAPGISVEPINTANLATNPGIGPYLSGIKLDGGSNTSGGWSSMSANPTSAVVASDNGAGGSGHLQVSPNLGTLRAHNATGEGSVEATPALSALTATSSGGARGRIEVSPSSSIVRTYSGTGPESGWVRAQATDAELASVGSDNVYTSRLRATATEASLFSRAGGTNRYLTVDANGVWVRTGAESYNLEQLAKDTGRTEFPTVAGIARVVAPTWRNKANMILFNGTVNKAWVVGWNSVAIGMPLVTRPDIEEVRNAPIPEPGYLIRITPGGGVDVYAPTAGARDVRLSGLTYPLG